jgi:dTDP-4-dehydrorhamnose 3,5-epimerase
MRFSSTALHDVVLIELDAAEDDRGFFARTYCTEEFARAGIAFTPVQTNLSHNRAALTLRGLHYQAAPHGEAKIVHCVRGRIFDVALDLRPASPSYRQWLGLELSPQSRRLLFIPEGCAHGFLTFEPDSDLVYVMGGIHMSEAARGIRWNDPAFAIEWPAAPAIISPRDAGYPDFVP